jgi:hypothetical protein
MTDPDKRQRGRRNRRVPAPQLRSRSGAEKIRRSSTHERSSADEQVAPTRTRRAPVLKTLKTGEERDSQAEENAGVGYARRNARSSSPSVLITVRLVTRRRKRHTVATASTPVLHLTTAPPD